MSLRLLRRIISVLFLFLILSLIYHQIIRGPYYSQLSQNNRIKLVRLAAARGSIYDCNGEVLAGQRLVFNLALAPQYIKDLEAIIARISPLLGIAESELLRRYGRGRSIPFIPVVVARDIPLEKALILECSESELPGLVIQTEPLRDYRYASNLSHIIGYIGRIREEELKELEGYGLHGLGNLVGRGGLEEQFDYYLRGEAGAMLAEVNNRGYQVRALGQRQPQKGEDLYLTIEAGLQNLAATLLEGNPGACIVINPQDGAIKAMVSKPDFSPNLFIDALNEKPQGLNQVARLLNSQEAPLINRAVSGQYPPGSIFKVVVAAAALEAEGFSPKARFDCPGSLLVGNREFLCWEPDGHGSQDLCEAIAHSCNVFFYRLGLELGANRISAFARKFGLGTPTDIDLPYEAKGIVPSKSWKLKNYRERWYAGETANFSIGQGYLLTTPLQIARALAAIANNGYLVRPYLVNRIGEQAVTPLRERIALNKETISVIKEGMRQAVQMKSGTAHRAKIAGIEWAAKTGTAQADRDLPHGWFAGFYPIEQPNDLILVFSEYGGSGGEIPAEIAKQLLEYIIKKDVDSRM